MTFSGIALRSFRRATCQIRGRSERATRVNPAVASTQVCARVSEKLNSNRIIPLENGREHASRFTAKPLSKVGWVRVSAFYRSDTRCMCA